MSYILTVQGLLLRCYHNIFKNIKILNETFTIKQLYENLHVYPQSTHLSYSVFASRCNSLGQVVTMLPTNEQSVCNHPSVVATVLDNQLKRLRGFPNNLRTTAHGVVWDLIAAARPPVAATCDLLQKSQQQSASK